MVSVLMMIGGLGLFLWEQHIGVSTETGRTMAVNAIVMSEMFYLINSRHTFASVLHPEGLTGNHMSCWRLLPACCCRLPILICRPCSPYSIRPI
ncbi:MAG: cation transporting ATPase C-terminal domain-containing protein [Nitrosomonas sp.]|nr:cation transporting ATPase C-terminal domain-containing protein [Nitrosomonas sp.]